MIRWFLRLLGVLPPRQDFTFMGKSYNGDEWELIDDPSDAYPMYGMKQDKTVRRLK